MKLFIAIPVYQGMCHIKFMECISALLLLLKQENIDFFYFSLTSESLISRARNMCASKFLKSDCTHMIFIDCDIVFNPKDVMNLLEHDKQIIGGIYPFKKLSFEAIKNNIYNSHNLNTLIENSATYHINKKSMDSIKTVDYIQTGFLLINKSVFETILAGIGSLIEYKNDIPGYEEYSHDGKLYDFFQVGIYNKKYLSEDYGFCSIVKEYNIPIYADPTIKLTHIGQFFFNG